MELEDTVDLMLSDDYKDRFLAEHHQVRERYIKLYNLISACDEERLDFEPSCPRHILHGQLCAMGAYKDFLTARAEIEGIDIGVEL